MKHGIVRTALVLVLGSAVVALSACAHQDLMAPCSRDGFLSTLGRAYASMIDCGPLLPVNR